MSCGGKEDLTLSYDTARSQVADFEEVETDEEAELRRPAEETKTMATAAGPRRNSSRKTEARMPLRLRDVEIASASFSNPTQVTGNPPTTRSTMAESTAVLFPPRETTRRNERL